MERKLFLCRLPTLLLHEYPKIYELFSWFYKQDPASRTQLLLEE